MAAGHLIRWKWKEAFAEGRAGGKGSIYRLVGCVRFPMRSGIISSQKVISIQQRSPGFPLRVTAFVRLSALESEVTHKRLDPGRRYEAERR